MASPRLSLRRRAPIKPPPPGVTLAAPPPRTQALRLDGLASGSSPRPPVEPGRPPETVASTAPPDSAPRMTPASPPRATSEPVQEVFAQREAVLAKAETELAAREHALREREAALREEERENVELKRLLELREERIATKETLLEDNAAALRDATALDHVQRLLANERTAHDALRVAHKETEARLRGLEEHLAELEARAEEAAKTDAPPPLSKENEAALQERERFIEESENALFNKAQELQELEHHLQQWKEELGVRAKALAKSAAAAR
ncbi:MAG: hypothetical protein ACLFR7_02550 [Opitutales bacterium]